MRANHSSLSPPLPTVADMANVTDFYDSLLAALRCSSERMPELFCLYVFLLKGLKSFQQQVGKKFNTAPTNSIINTAASTER